MSHYGHALAYHGITTPAENQNSLLVHALTACQHRLEAQQNTEVQAWAGRSKLQMKPNTSFSSLPLYSGHVILAQ